MQVCEQLGPKKPRSSQVELLCCRLTHYCIGMLSFGLMINQAPGFIRKYQKHTKTRKLEHQKLKNIKREREMVDQSRIKLRS